MKHRNRRFQYFAKALLLIAVSQIPVLFFILSNYLLFSQNLSPDEHEAQARLWFEFKRLVGFMLASWAFLAAYATAAVGSSKKPLNDTFSLPDEAAS